MTAASYTPFLVVLTHLPPAGLPPVAGGDKLHHVTGYALLSLVWALACGVRGPRGAALVVAVGALFGAADELTQPLVGRVCDPLDWTADVTGAAVGATLALVARRAAETVGWAHRPPQLAGAT